MNNSTTFVTATSSVLGYDRTGEAAVARCTVPAVVPIVHGRGLPIGAPSGRMVDRTRLPFAATGMRFDALGAGGAVDADQVKTTAVRIAATADQGDPPRRTPPRC